MYRVMWYLPEAKGDHTELLEEVLPSHADALGAAGCWKVVAARVDGAAVVEVWADSETTVNRLLSSEAGTAFRSAVERWGGSIKEARGGADEAVTLHISALRMG